MWKTEGPRKQRKYYNDVKRCRREGEKRSHRCIFDNGHRSTSAKIGSPIILIDVSAEYFVEGDSMIGAQIDAVGSFCGLTGIIPCWSPETTMRRLSASHEICTLTQAQAFRAASICR